MNKMNTISGSAASPSKPRLIFGGAIFISGFFVTAGYPTGYRLGSIHRMESYSVGSAVTWRTGSFYVDRHSNSRQTGLRLFKITSLEAHKTVGQSQCYALSYRPGFISSANNIWLVISLSGIMDYRVASISDGVGDYG